MNVYTPDCWVIVNLISEEHGVVSKVFAGWYGGYGGSDSWKMNSGITGIKSDGDFYEFTGVSGSVYRCHKSAERMSGYMSSVFSNFKSQETETTKIEIVEVKDIRCQFASGK